MQKYISYKCFEVFESENNKVGVQFRMLSCVLVTKDVNRSAGYSQFVTAINYNIPTLL
jgi:hypothetical protein